MLSSLKWFIYSMNLSQNYALVMVCFYFVLSPRLEKSYDTTSEDQDTKKLETQTQNTLLSAIIVFSYLFAYLFCRTESQ